MVDDDIIPSDLPGMGTQLMGEERVSRGGIARELSREKYSRGRKGKEMRVRAVIVGYFLMNAAERRGDGAEVQCNRRQDEWHGASVPGTSLCEALDDPRNKEKCWTRHGRIALWHSFVCILS